MVFTTKTPLEIVTYFYWAKQYYYIQKLCCASNKTSNGRQVYLILFLVVCQELGMDFAMKRSRVSFLLLFRFRYFHQLSIISRLLEQSSIPLSSRLRELTGATARAKSYLGAVSACAVTLHSNPKGPFIYYVSTFFINCNIFTNFLSIFLYVLKISNYSMKILPKCNVEIEIPLF